MRSIDDTVHFVDGVMMYGTYNGVIHLDLCSLLMEPTADAKVNLEMAINCRLRMGEACARQIVANLTTQLNHLDQTRGIAAAQIDASPAPEGAKAN